MYNLDDLFRYTSDGVFGFVIGIKTMSDFRQKLMEYVEYDPFMYLVGSLQNYLPGLIILNTVRQHDDRRKDNIIFCAAYWLGVATAATVLLSVENSADDNDCYTVSRLSINSG
jgi:hypothetical protein